MMLKKPVRNTGILLKIVEKRGNFPYTDNLRFIPCCIFTPMETLIRELNRTVEENNIQNVISSATLKPLHTHLAQRLFF